MSVCISAVSEVKMIAITDSAKTSGAKVWLASGSIGSEIRMKP